MNQFKQLPTQILGFFKRYGVMLVIIGFAGIYGYLIVTSSNLSQVEPSETEVTEQYQGVKRPKMDPAIAKKLNELQDQNVTFKALIDEARNNPFEEN